METSASIVFFTLLIVIESVKLSNGMVYSLSSNWSVSANSSLEAYTTLEGTFKVLKDSTGNNILSSNGRYGFGFLQIKSTSNVLLCVAMGLNLTVPGTIIWSANRNSPASNGAKLHINNASLVLADINSVNVWNISVGDSPILNLTDSGNLQIYNGSKNLVWQSWDHPTDTLLPEQSLAYGKALVANSSAINTSTGNYSMKTERGGLVLMHLGQPYWSLGLPGLGNLGVFSGCGVNSVVAVYTGLNLQVLRDGENSSYCGSGNGSLSIAPSNNESEFRHLRLDVDGNLRSHRIAMVPGSNSSAHWMPDFGIDQLDRCALPLVCGPYGICSSNGQCSCPGSGTPDFFELINNRDVSQGCKSKLAPTACSDTNSSSTNHHYLRLDSADYYPNDYTVPVTNITTTEECTSYCSNNCTCGAAFFRNTTKSCYIATFPLGSIKTVSNSTYVAHLKLLNNKPNKTSAGPSKAAIIGIAVGLVSAGALICGVIMAIFWKRRKNTAKHLISEDETEPDLDEIEEAAFLKTLPGLPPRYKYVDLKEATWNFTIKLGSGGFGSVYEGVLHDCKTKVAVKKLDGPRQGYKEFRAEVATIGSINHVNLVRLRGFCADSKQRLLVYDLMENGSVDKWLFAKEKCLTWSQRYSIAVGTAKGLVYLHEECRDAILHLDIKPQNILLDKNFVPKVADFGMSRLLKEGDMTEIVTAVRGTPGYLAPEWLRHSVATKKCDVYSFGMVLLELVSGRKNFDPQASDPRLCYFPAWAMLRALDGSFMELLDPRLKDEDVDMEGLARVVRVAFWCIQDNPTKRPWMGVVLKMLEGEVQVPEAPYWLLQRGPEFLEGYGYGPMDAHTESNISNGQQLENSSSSSVFLLSTPPPNIFDQNYSVSDIQLSGPR